MRSRRWNGRAELVGQAPRLHERAQAARHTRVLPVGELVLVGHGEGPVVAGDRVGRHLRRLFGPEGPGVHEREVGHVEEVVGQQPGRRPGAQRRQLAQHERRVGRLGQGAERRNRLLWRHEHHAVRLGHRGGGRQPRRRWQHRPGTESGDLHATAGTVKAPPVVRALQHPVLTLAQRERTMAVRTTVHECDDLSARSVQHPGLPQEHSPEGLLAHFGRPGHRMPAPAQGRVRVGEEAAHGDTLQRRMEWRQGPPQPVTRLRSPL